ncbi:MAG: hypothetical protein Kow0059_11650 [Candidatus Sumerlaeia bacterium]
MDFGDKGPLNMLSRSSATLLLLIALGLTAGAGAQDETPAPSGTAAARPVSPATVIATVNGEPVTQAQVELYYVQYMAYYGDQLNPDALLSRQPQVETQAYELALKGAIIRQLGAERGLNPSGAAVAAARKQLYDILGVQTEEQLQDILKQRGIPEAEVERFIRTHLINLSLYAAWTRDNPTTITTAMAKIFYERNPELHSRPAQARVRHILLLTTGLGEDEKIRKRNRAQEALRRLREGADFAAVAAEFSDDPSAQNGGDYGWIKAGAADPLVEKAVFSLQPGQISDIVESPYGFHIFKVEEKRPEEALSFDRVKDVLIPQMRYQLEKKKFQDWLDLKLSEADVVVPSLESARPTPAP